MFSLKKPAQADTKPIHRHPTTDSSKIILSQSMSTMLNRIIVLMTIVCGWNAWENQTSMMLDGFSIAKIIAVLVVIFLAFVMVFAAGMAFDKKQPDAYRVAMALVLFGLVVLDMLAISQNKSTVALTAIQSNAKFMSDKKNRDEKLSQLYAQLRTCPPNLNKACRLPTLQKIQILETESNGVKFDAESMAVAQYWSAQAETWNQVLGTKMNAAEMIVARNQAIALFLVLILVLACGIKENHIVIDLSSAPELGAVKKELPPQVPPTAPDLGAVKNALPPTAIENINYNADLIPSYTPPPAPPLFNSSNMEQPYLFNHKINASNLAVAQATPPPVVIEPVVAPMLPMPEKPQNQFFVVKKAVQNTNLHEPLIIKELPPEGTSSAPCSSDLLPPEGTSSAPCSSDKPDFVPNYADAFENQWRAVYLDFIQDLRKKVIISATTRKIGEWIKQKGITNSNALARDQIAPNFIMQALRDNIIYRVEGRTDQNPKGLYDLVG